MATKSVKHLKNIPLFASVPEKDLELIAADLQDSNFKSGEAIIQEGEFGNCLYVIKSGRVKVVKSLNAEENEEIILSHLEDGDYFGEMSLITGDPRSATVIAESDVDLWKLSKTDFDHLILNNKGITISLTHMLSQRLQQANREREISEKKYKKKFTPRGNLKDTDIIKLLKFAEENSLTGIVRIKHDGEMALFYYDKGQLQRLDFKDKDEDEAMDEILQWTEGQFIVEPALFNFHEEVTGETPDGRAGDSKDFRDMDVIRFYFEEKLTDLIRYAGSKLIQSALNKSYFKFKDYFDVTEDIQVQASPDLKVNIKSSSKWTEKHALFSAVLLRDVVKTIEKEVIGINYWSLKSQNNKVNARLMEMEFFDYYNQAMDFIKD